MSPLPIIISAWGHNIHTCPGLARHAHHHFLNRAHTRHRVRRRISGRRTACGPPMPRHLSFLPRHYSFSRLLGWIGHVPARHVAVDQPDPDVIHRASSKAPRQAEVSPICVHVVSDLIQAGILRPVPLGSSRSIGSLKVLIMQEKVKLVYDARLPNLAMALVGVVSKLDPYFLPSLVSLVRSPVPGIVATLHSPRLLTAG